MKKVFKLDESLFKFPQEINRIIFNTLKYGGYSKYFNLFKDNIELLPLVANLINYYAKVESYDWYEYKHILLKYMLDKHSFAWLDDESHIAYFETPYGQISFHVHYIDLNYADLQTFLTSKENREWSGEEMQMNGKAIELIEQVIEDFERNI